MCIKEGLLPCFKFYAMKNSKIGCGYCENYNFSLQLRYYLAERVNIAIQSQITQNKYIIAVGQKTVVTLVILALEVSDSTPNKNNILCLKGDLNTWFSILKVSLLLGMLF